MTLGKKDHPGLLIIGTLIFCVAGIAAGALYASNKASAFFDDIDWESSW